MSNKTKENSKDVNMYLDATMTFTKVINPEQNQVSVNFAVSAIDFEAFLTLPFQNNTGVAMPYEIVDEDDKAYTFRVQIIDPISLSL
jgi:hypothetical protein